MRALRVLAAVLVVSRAAEPGAELEGDEELASWLEALASRGPELPPAAFLGLRLSYERPVGGRPLRGPDRARPVVPPQWSADMLFDGDSMGMNSTGGVGRYLYDRDHQRNRMTYDASMNYFRLNQTQLRDTLTAHGERQMTYGEGKDGACMDFQGGPRRSSLTDPWAWLFVAAHMGTREAYDGTCDVWRAKIPGFFGVQGSVEACFGADGAARDVTQSFSGRGWGFQQSMVFSNVSVGPLPDEAFAPSYACAENFPAVPCEGRGVETLQLYRIGGAEPLELRNRNTGDDLGDLSFLCTQDSGAQYQQKLVTWWSVEVNTSYGQYALCNFNGTRNVCSSGALDRVGRRGSQMAGAPRPEESSSLHVLCRICLRVPHRSGAACAQLRCRCRAQQDMPRDRVDVSSGLQESGIMMNY